MTTGDKWVRMTAAEYAEFTTGRHADRREYVIGFEDGYKDGLKKGYERGMADGRQFERALTRHYDEQENDENFND